MPLKRQEQTVMDLEYLKKLSSGFLAGCDEVGRGPIAGPVVAATASIDCTDEKLLTILKDKGITDSKKLTSKKRRLILNALEIDIEAVVANQKYSRSLNNVSFQFCLREISPSLIDEINILNASLKAMSDSAVKCVGNHSGILLVDGNRIPSELPANFQAIPIVKGDSKSVLIGLASIIAKEYRDHLMMEMDQKYPGYGFANHAGYPTVKHLDCVKKLGPCPIHRRSFKGVKEYF